MFKRYLAPQLLLSPEDAGGAGASTAEGGAGDSQSHEESTSDDVSDAGTSRADGAPADDDDDDSLVSDEDFSDTPFHAHPRFKAVTSKLKKVARQNARLRAESARYKGVDLDTLRSRAGVAEQLEGLFTRNRTLHKQVLDALANGDQRAADEPEFDPKQLPFDTTDDVGKYFVQQDKQIRQLTKQLETLASTNAATQRRSVERSWKDATLAASSELPDHVKVLFEDAMYGAYKLAHHEGRTIDPQKFVQQYLGKLKARGLITGKAAARSAAASQQRSAENNKHLPRQPAGGGAPASTKVKGETVIDVNRRLKSMWR